MFNFFLPLLVRLTESPNYVRRRAAGQGLVEYALITLFVVIVVVGILAAVGRTLCTTWYVKLVNISAWGAGAAPEPNPCQ